MIKKLHNGTLKTVTNIRVPKKWKRFEYLESTGTQWIDTGLIGTSNMRIELTFMSGSTVDRMFGAGPPGDNAIYLMANYDGASTLGIRYFGIATNIPYTINTKCHIVITNSELIKDGIHQITLNKTGSTINTLTLFMYNSSPISTNTKIYEYKVYDGPTLIQHFVPCEYNGRYGMQDLVENKFYGNKGTGTFKVGPEVPNYDEIEYIKRPNHLLPNGVELYDYIESTGTQYIDTLWIPKYSKGFEVACNWWASSKGSRGLILSNYNTGGNTVSFEVITGSRCYLNSSAVDTTYTCAMETQHTSVFNVTKTSYSHAVDGTIRASSTSQNFSTDCTSSAYMFLDRALRTSTFNKNFRIYHLSIKEGTTLVRNFLPCTYFGEPGMWDTVTNKFYGNSGTGQFKLGNKIELKEYEWLENSINSYINTDFIPNSDSRAVLKVINTLYNSTRAAFTFGSRIDITSQAFYTYMYKSNLKWCGNWDSNSDNITTSELGPDGIIDFNKNILSINNKIVKEFNNVTWQGTKPVFIFGVNTNGSLDYQQGTYKLFYCKLYDNNTLVRDYYPCSCNGEYGLWDRVELKFYPNAGTGSFTVGPRIDGNINIYEKKNALVGDGTAYINPNLSLTLQNSTEVYCKINISQGNWNGANWASQADWSKITINKDVDFKLISKSDGTNFTVRGYENDIQITAMDRNWKCSQNSNTFAFLIFNMATGSTAIPGYPTTKGKIYYYRIYVDGKLVRDFIPATLGGKPGLYDKVEHKMYYNANSTGQFTVE